MAEQSSGSIQQRASHLYAALTGLTITAIIALTTAALQIAGVTSMAVAHFLLILAWIIGTLSIFLFPSQKERSHAKALSFVLFTAGLFLFDRWMVWMAPKPGVEYTGILTPASLQQGKFPQIEIGDSGIAFRFTEPSGRPLLQVFYDAGFTIESIEGQVKVSIKIRDRSGNMVAELIRNEWKATQPHSWDINYTKDALEVKDARGVVVLQVRVLPGCIQLQGEWWNDTGGGWRLVKSSDPRIGGGGLIIPLDRVPNPHLNPVEPIFNYPSSTHLGEINISHIIPQNCNASIRNK